MKILINDVPISFELETEKNAGEVLDGIENWLKTSGHRIDRVLLDGTAVDEEEGWRETAVGQVGQMDITAVSLHQSTIDKLETIINYLDLLRRVATDGDDQQVETVLEEFSHVSEAIHRIAPELAPVLDAGVEGYRQEHPGGREDLARRAEELSAVLQQRQRELLDPEHELRSTISAFGTMLPAFEEIPARLQAGKEREALEMVARFAELTSRLLRILPLTLGVRPDLSEVTVDGESPDASLSKLAALFRELEEAMQNQDLVLVGDLLEYELLPGLDQIAKAYGTALDKPR